MKQESINIKWERKIILLDERKQQFDLDDNP